MLLTALALAALASPGWAYDPRQTFQRGASVLSLEGGYGEQFNLEGFDDWSHLRFWNAGVRASLLPFEPLGSGAGLGALEVGVEPLVQHYVDPDSATWAGLAAVGRYHFIGLGRLVPYVEVAAAAGGTDLRVREIDSSFAFLLWGGVGASLFVTDRAALYAGYRLQHISNGNTDQPERGFESHWGVIGVSRFFP